MGRSLAAKVWDAHVVERLPGDNALLFVDLIVAYELTAPPGIRTIEREHGGRLYDPSRIVAINDHIAPAKDSASALQARVLREWAREHGVRHHDLGDGGICHVVVPERGYVVPGTTAICGDSHTCTLGAVGALAFGVGTTALAGAMLGGTVVAQRPRVYRIRVDGRLGPDVTAKDLAIAVVRELGADGGNGAILEYDGPAIDALGMDGRMTLCNMAVEAGATTAIIAADDVTAAFLAATERAPSGWTRLRADADAEYDRELAIDASALQPLISWGTNPGQATTLDGTVPVDADPAALAYMDLTPGQALRGLPIDQVFIGSCTNARMGDLRVAAELLRGERVRVPTIVTPGSEAVRRQAEREGLADTFRDAGALWTHATCGACCGLSMGVLAPGMRCVSTSNRNFPGRMGEGGRVHLASPRVAAASAILGRIGAPSDLAHAAAFAEAFS